MRRPSGEKAIQRAWKPSELSGLWDFCQHDFARFLKLLVWLDQLK
jgi:hypothetical protein